jgi:hypothetical protein
MFRKVQSEGDPRVQTNPNMCSKQMDKVTMTIHHVIQCNPDMDPDVPRELRSEGHEELEIKYEEKAVSPWDNTEGELAGLYD